MAKSRSPVWPAVWAVRRRPVQPAAAAAAAAAVWPIRRWRLPAAAAVRAIRRRAVRPAAAAAVRPAGAPHRRGAGMARAADDEGLNGAPARLVAPRARSPFDRSATSASPHAHCLVRSLPARALCAALAQPAAPSNASFRPEEEDDEPEPVMPSAAAQPTPAADEKAPGDYDDVRECLANAPPPPLTPPPHRGRRHRCRGGPSLIHT